MNETSWDCAWSEQKNAWAEEAGLLRPSAFTRNLPPWHELPEDWKIKLSDSAQGGQS